MSVLLRLLLLLLPVMASGLLIAPTEASVTIEPAPGFAITWDGNDGDHFAPGAPPSGALVRDNLALASRGATAISSSDLGPQLGVAFHVAANLNDGYYGNANCWISADDDAEGAAGVLLGGALFGVTAVAWGRDNGNGAFDDSDPGTDCCGGQVDDRWAGLYTLQFTDDDGSSWTTIGTLDYGRNEDTIPGGDFTGYFRHQYDVGTAAGAPIQANGVRLLVPATGLGGGTAIDEIEVYGLPEPSSNLLLLGSMVAMGSIRRCSMKRRKQDPGRPMGVRRAQ